MSNIKHIPVMYEQVIENLPKSMKIYMDGTVGHAGHCKMILEKYNTLQAIAVDKDNKMLDISKHNLQSYGDSVEFINSSYKNLDKILGNRKVDVILLDLGVNMQHFKDPERGFSIKNNGPLDMRFDNKQTVTAQYILKNYNKEQLQEILQKYGDFKGKILQDMSEMIVKNKHKLNSTSDLVELMKSVGLSSKKIAVLFQVLRIEVNHELLELEDFLKIFGKYLNPGGRCLILTYHSIEDRMVKTFFKKMHNDGFNNLTKKVIFPTLDEIQKNKASRSAKLRIIEKI